MAKVYVFGIGGTGSRVIKSLTLLCAAGIEPEGFEIVPMIIDPDEANGDVTRTVELLKNYGNVHRSLDFTGDSNRFFKAGIRPVVDSFRMPLTGISDNKFKDYIDYANLDRTNKALTSLLFSEDNLDTRMNVGFKGNPNIGSVVLNQFSQSEYFRQFANSFQDGDRIFIISSIFGGTGAAGFPLIVKNLRELAAPFPNWALIKNAPIGAITVLPYFGVTADENSKIDKSTFISKTKAALAYYRKNISGNKSLNALYYIGDNIVKDYENKEGSTGQKNDAHFVELAAALSILDFTQISTQYLSSGEDANRRVVANDPLYKEFGIKSDDSNITFLSLAQSTQNKLKKPLTQYFLFVKYLDEQLRPEGLTRVWAKGVFDERFLGEPFYSSFLKNVNIHFKEWIAELARNERSFSPFNTDTGKNNLFDCVKRVKSSRSILKADNYDFYDARLNDVSNSNRDTKKEQKFISLFYGATKQAVERKFNFK
jgi:hypothetical protein